MTSGVEHRARLIDVNVPAQPSAAVLVLHGGGGRERGAMVSPAQLSVLRMIPIARRLRSRAPAELAVFRLLNSFRGWDNTFTPVDDVRWALTEIQARLGDLAVGLVGHSLGGRAALSSGSERRVKSVVALNPWLYPSEHVRQIAAPVMIVHGDQDRIASPKRSLAVARQLAAAGTTVAYVSVKGAKHAMLRRGRRFEELAADFTAATLLGIAGDRLPSELRKATTNPALVAV
jgi:pimeloyl-ACP methyl ester carboxylesterase